MKANDMDSGAIRFVKKFGWDVAQELLKNSWDEKLIVHVGYATDGFELTEIIVKDDLKQLIEAKELVEFIGNDLSGAKQVYEFTKKSVNIAISDRVVSVESLKKAIQLVESVDE